MHTQQPNRNPEKNNHGYSIIEAMIALGILSIGLLAIISMQVSSTANVRKSGDSTEAISLGTAELERLMAFSYTDLNTPSVVPNPGTRNNQGSGQRFDISWSVTAATPAPNTVTITVNVSWDPQTGGGTQTMTLTSVKADMNL